MPDCNLPSVDQSRIGCPRRLPLPLTGLPEKNHDKNLPTQDTSQGSPWGRDLLGPAAAFPRKNHRPGLPPGHIHRSGLRGPNPARRPQSWQPGKPRPPSLARMGGKGVRAAGSLRAGSRFQQLRALHAAARPGPARGGSGELPRRQARQDLRRQRQNGCRAHRAGLSGRQCSLCVGARRAEPPAA